MKLKKNERWLIRKKKVQRKLKETNKRPQEPYQSDGVKEKEVERTGMEEEEEEEGIQTDNTNEEILLMDVVSQDVKEKEEEEEEGRDGENGDCNVKREKKGQLEMESELQDEGQVLPSQNPERQKMIQEAISRLEETDEIESLEEGEIDETLEDEKSSQDATHRHYIPAIPLTEPDPKELNPNVNIQKATNIFKDILNRHYNYLNNAEVVQISTVKELLENKDRYGYTGLANLSRTQYLYCLPALLEKFMSSNSEVRKGISEILRYHNCFWCLYYEGGLAYSFIHASNKYEGSFILGWVMKIGSKVDTLNYICFDRLIVGPEILPAIESEYKNILKDMFNPISIA